MALLQEAKSEGPHSNRESRSGPRRAEMLAVLAAGYHITCRDLPFVTVNMRLAWQNPEVLIVDPVRGQAASKQSLAPDKTSLRMSTRSQIFWLPLRVDGALL